MCVPSDATVFDSVTVVESTKYQTAFVIDGHSKLIGIVTNGDIRRYIISGGQMDAPVVDCMNRRFRAAPVSANRESVLKIMDLGYSVVPVVDEVGRYIDFFAFGRTNVLAEAKTTIRARAPVRISFFGGGSDLISYYNHRDGLVLSASIAKFAHCTLSPRSDGKIRINSQDLVVSEYFESPEVFRDSQPQTLASAVVKAIEVDSGFDLHVYSDVPIGSGLGGSSAVATSIIAAFNELRSSRWTSFDIAELAFMAERLLFGVAGGWQDQYACSFGGFNLIEFRSTETVVNPIRLDPDIVSELECSLALVNTKRSRDSGKLHQNHTEDQSTEKDKTLSRMVEFCRKMHRHLIKGELADFGIGLNEAWELKRNAFPGATDPSVDSIYECAKQAGALGGKLLGGGMGGYFLFFVDPGQRPYLTAELESRFGLQVERIFFENHGARSWRAPK